MTAAPKILVEFDESIEGDDGRPYRARVLGAETPLGHWEGWLEFSAADGSSPISSGRETTQPNLTDLGYWATGLTRVYLQGALRRALAHAQPAGQRPIQSARPTSAPAHAPPKSPQRARPSGPARAKLPPSAHGTPVLDPFAVYAQSEGILRQELRALSADHLRTIIDAYGLDADVPMPQETADPGREVLAERIVSAVKKLAATA
jgi:hypothetical protein